MSRLLAVSAAAAAYLAAIAVEPAIHTDTARDILLARDGLQLGIFEGCSASFGGFQQGALWARLLGVTFALGIGPVGQYWIAAGLLALSAGLFDRMVRVHFGADMGRLPVALYLPLVVLAVGFPNLWQPMLGGLGVVAVTWALLAVVTTGALAAAGAAAAGLALAAEGTWSAYLALPVVVLAVLASCPRPLVALGVAAAGGALPSLAFSRTPWVANLRALAAERWYVVFVAFGLLITVILAGAGRQRWLALPVETRRCSLLVALAAAVVAQIGAACLLSRRLLFSPHYFLTVLPALVILAGLWVRRARRRGDVARVRLAVAAVASVVAVPLAGAMVWRLGVATGTAAIPTYAMREARMLARHLWKAGYTFPDAQRHVRGPDGLELMTAMASYAPRPLDEAARSIPDLRVLTFAAAQRPAMALPAGGAEVALGRGRRAWILPLAGWVGLAPSRFCVGPFAGAGNAPTCVDVTTASIEYRGRYRDLAYPALPGVIDALIAFQHTSGGAPAEATWALPIRIDGDDAERHVTLATIIDLPWSIERVDGVGHRGTLPARHVVLDRSGSPTGTLVLSAHALPRRAYPPDLLETRPDEAALRDALTRLPPLGRTMCGWLGTCP